MSGILTHSPADVALQVLIGMGLVTDPGLDPREDWPGYFEAEPDFPDQVVTITTTQGREGGRDMIGGTVIMHYGMQLRFRSRTSRAGYEKAKAVADSIAKNVDRGTNGFVVIGSTQYLLECFTEVGDVLPLGQDPNSARFIHTVNALASIKQLN